MRNHSHLVVLVPTVLVLALAMGCTKSAVTDSDLGTGAGFLRYVPADSALVWANLKPIPNDLWEALAAKLAPVADLLQEGIEHALTDESTSEEQRKLLRLLNGKVNRAGLEELGIHTRPQYAVYSIGWSLVVRVQLADPSKFQNLLNHVEAASDKRWPRATLGSQKYYSFADDGALLAIAVTAEDMVVAVMPERAAPAVLPVAFHQQRPAKSVAQTGALEKVVADYKLSGVFPGYIDFVRLAELLTGGGSDLSRQTMAAATFDDGLSETCRQEFRSLAQVAPRMVFGYTNVSMPLLRGVWAWEMRPDIAAGLERIVYPIPGISRLEDLKAAFAFGIGIDMGETLDWVQQRAEAIAAAPYACPTLAVLNEAARQLGAAANDAPMPVRWVRGLVVAITGFDPKNSEQPVTSGFGFLDAENIGALLALAQAAKPDLIPSGLTSGAPPVKVNIPLPVKFPGDLVAAVRGDRLGFALGQATPMVALLDEERPKMAPALAFSYNYGLLMSSMVAGRSGVNTSAVSSFERRAVELMGGLGTITQTIGFSSRGVVGEFVWDLR